MPFFVPALMTGISALAGAMGNRSQTQQQESSTTSNQNQTTRPIYDDKQAAIRDFMLQALMGNVENSPQLGNAFLDSSIRGINQQYGAGVNGILQLMVSRGLGRTSAGIAPEMALEGNRMGAIAQAYGQVPMVNYETNRNALGDLASFFSSLPVATNTTGTTTSNTKGTATTPGNMLGGSLGNGAQMAAFLYGNGAFGKKTPGMGNT
jgi:hypothetical protein